MTVADYVEEMDNAYEKVKSLCWSNLHTTGDDILRMAFELKKAELLQMQLKEPKRNDS